ncbi:hypothetical protein AXF42_Ash000833 [Apostasia shenzhenica]|uniref:Uncharacterized protein n=1 Tax=Apostasia shenzhenica TaxID=1088818 RepID=A0A2I0AT70_9ASPA|nr:hypothetical protein AXF42_Ash000833 [Apostasia shenzhenica]
MASAGRPLLLSRVVVVIVVVLCVTTVASSPEDPRTRLPTGYTSVARIRGHTIATTIAAVCYGVFDLYYFEIRYQNFPDNNYGNLLFELALHAGVRIVHHRPEYIGVFSARKEDGTRVVCKISAFLLEFPFSYDHIDPSSGRIVDIVEL